MERIATSNARNLSPSSSTGGGAGAATVRVVTAASPGGPYQGGVVDSVPGDVIYIWVGILPMSVQPGTPGSGLRSFVFQLAMKSLLQGDKIAPVESEDHVIPGGSFTGRLKPYADLSMSQSSTSGQLQVFRNATNARIAGAYSNGIADASRGIQSGQLPGNQDALDSQNHLLYVSLKLSTDQTPRTIDINVPIASVLGERAEFFTDASNNYTVDDIVESKIYGLRVRINGGGTQ